MTAYGFDLDETLDKLALAQLANDLYDAGHEVYVLAGSIAAEGEHTLEGRRAKLQRLGVRYTKLVHCVDPHVTLRGRLKGAACNEHGIVLVIDDNPDMLAGVADVSPVTRLLVL